MVIVRFAVYDTREKIKRWYYTIPQDNVFWDFSYAQSFKVKKLGSLILDGFTSANYPMNGEHLRFYDLDVPADIYRGLDPFHYTCAKDSKEKIIRRNLYFAEFKDELSDCRSRQFVKCTDAIEYIFKKYKEYLTVSLKKIEKKTEQ